MKNKSPSEWTRFLDREPVRPAWESDPGARREREKWEAIRAELPAALRPPALSHPDFINTNVMEVIGRVERRSSGSPVLLWRWAFGCLAAALVLALVWVPEVLRPGASSGFGSQVVALHAVHPQISAAAFPVPGDEGVVVWLEGAPYIPEGDQLR